MVECYRKRISSAVGLGFATIGLILLIAAQVTYASKWSDEDCCGDSPSAECQRSLPNQLGLSCEIGCAFDDNRSNFVDEGCCYAIAQTSPDFLVFLWGGGAFLVVLITFLVGECGDKCGDQCCQNITGGIVCCCDGIGLIFVVILFVALLGTQDNDASSCDAASLQQILGVSGIFLAASVFMLIAVVCAMVTTFIGCCCDDAPDAKFGADKTANAAI